MFLVAVSSVLVLGITLLFLIRQRKRSNVLMVVLGSGGHTGEMFSLLDSCFPNLTKDKQDIEQNKTGYNENEEKKRNENEDEWKNQKAEEENYEKEFKEIVKNIGEDEGNRIALKPSLGDIDQLLFLSSTNDRLSLQRLSSVKLDYQHVQVTRARDVHESLLSAIPKIMSSTLQALYLIYTVRPGALLTNGPGVCLPLLIAARILSPGTKCVFVESVCRTRTLSLTGKILYKLRIVEHFFVQWPRLHQLYPRSRYIGLLV